MEKAKPTALCFTLCQAMSSLCPVIRVKAVSMTDPHTGHNPPSAGFQPESPTAEAENAPLEEESTGLPLKTFYEKGLRTVQQIQKLAAPVVKTDTVGLSAEVAFHVLLATGPGILFLVTLLGLMGYENDFLHTILLMLNELAPTNITTFLYALMDDVVTGSSGQLALLSLAIAVWGASNAAFVVIKGLNRIYGYDLFHHKPPMFYLRQKGMAILIVIMAGITLVVSSNMLVFGESLTQFLDKYNLWHADAWWWSQDIHWIFAVILMTGFTTMIYSQFPGPLRVRFPYKPCLMGATFFVGSWLILSVLFQVYVQTVGQFNQVYGALGAVVVIMIWLYLTAFLFFLGGHLVIRLMPEIDWAERTHLSKKPQHPEEIQQL